VTHARFMELKPAMAAFERDGKVECKWRVGSEQWSVTFDPQWNPECDYRPCPKPKVKRWRPWTVEEVPLGKEVRQKNGNRRIILTDSLICDIEGLFKYYTLADGTPCGVEEEIEAP